MDSVLHQKLYIHLSSIPASVLLHELIMLFTVLLYNYPQGNGLNIFFIQLSILELFCLLEYSNVPLQ